MPVNRLESKIPTLFWHQAIAELLAQLQSSPQGLAQTTAESRLDQFGHNRLHKQQSASAWRLLLAQFKSSIVLILLVATALSFYLHDKLDALIILGIIFISALLGFWQEKGAGDIIPAEKSADTLPSDTPLGQRHNCLWMGSHLQSGSAMALVIATGKNNEFGKLSERGVHRFGYLLMEQFRTGWFTKSVISAALIVFVVRSQHSMFASRPRRYLTLATLTVIVLTLLLPYSPLAVPLGFQPLTPIILGLLALIIVL